MQTPIGIKHWHGVKWWHDEQYRTLFNPAIALTQVDAAIARVAEVFNVKWAERAEIGFAERTERHPALTFLLARGTMSLASLLDLGSDLLAVDGSYRLPSITRDLRQPSLYLSTRLELCLAAALRRENHAVAFRPVLPNGRESDLVCDGGGQRIFVESKRLLESVVQLSTLRLSIAIVSAFFELQRSGLWSTFGPMGYEIVLSDRINGLFGAGPEIDQATITGLVTKIIIRMRNRLASSKPPFEFDIARLAHIRVGPDAKCTLAGPTLDPVADLKRILQQHLKDAGSQLHPDHPGLLIVQSGSVVDSTIARLTIEQQLQRQHETASHVSAVITLPVYSLFPVRASMFRAFTVFNPAARFPASDLVAYQTLRRAFELSE
jgi:hypothetical protein